MSRFKLRYGREQIELSQSQSLIGVRPRQNRDQDAELAMRQALRGASWTEEGTLGGFRVLAVDDAKIDVDKALDSIRLNGSVSAGTHVFELPNGRGIYVPTGELYVEFKPGTSAKNREAAIDRFHLSIKETRGADGFVVVVTPDSPNPVKVAHGLQRNANVAVAEPDLASRPVTKAFALPTDALLVEQWHLRNTAFHRNTSVGFVKGADARVVEAWEAAGSIGRPDVIVAVIDDGFDLKHPDLAMPGKLVHPWDFTRRGPDPSPAADDWHGTACAGVAVAAAGGGGVIGAAPGCTLMPVRWGVDLADGQIEAWFDYVTRKGAWVVSCSWGALNPYFPLSTRAYRAIERCARQGRGGKGCVVVFAAGNENHDVNDPGKGTLDGFAVHPDVIAVAASTSRDARSNYSNFGREISICAPSNGAGGWGIVTSDVTGADPRTGRPLGYDEGDYTYDFGGTSSACPLVAGIAALVLSVNPDLTNAQVKDLLQRTARKIGKASDYKNGHSPAYGYGCVNALAAVRAVLPRAQRRAVSLVRRSATRTARARRRLPNSSFDQTRRLTWSR